LDNVVNKYELSVQSQCFTYVIPALESLFEANMGYITRPQNKKLIVYFKIVKDGSLYSFTIIN
jgi:hypothetical protein